ncbi:MAG TPA: hypothetical protein VMX12_08330 [Acidimicrobiia bacterium]|nr:hypothetical protein [Acidimicrobiia bacterium]
MSSEQYPGQSRTLPANSASARVLGRSGADQGDIASLVETEKKLTKLEREADQLADDFAEMAEIEAVCATQWESHRDRIYLVLRAEDSWKNADLSQAEAKGMVDPITGQTGDDLYTAWRIIKSSLDSISKRMTTNGNRMTAQQSMLKHLRQVTGLDR